MTDEEFDQRHDKEYILGRTGCRGVQFVGGRKEMYVVAKIRILNKAKVVYSGRDLFEAFCARKSAENYKNSLSI